MERLKITLLTESAAIYYPG